MRPFFLFSALLSTVLAAPQQQHTSTVTSSISTSTGSSSSSSSCENSATSRSCWGDYDLSTNYYDEVPDTGVTREYWFELVNTTGSPDGYERYLLTVNGSVPGPTIIADWGDTVVVHLTNGLANNGTSLHFHGIRQNYTNDQDGVASVTQCPTAPGDSITYTWRATQYGSTWYHSHFFLQAWEGVFGAIVINGPASADYDNDLGPLILTDWSHETIDEKFNAEQVSGPPTLDNILFNGTNTYEADVGSKLEISVTAGETYRLRLVNGAADNHLMFSIDNHTMTVIAADLVPVEPFDVTALPIGMGQRYDVVFTASMGSGNYWIRVETQCTTVHNSDDLTAILRYDSSSTEDPSSTSWDYDTNCGDLDITSLVPSLSMDAGSDAVEDDFAVTVGFNSKNVFRWYMNDVTFVSQWKYPTTLAIWEGNETWSTQEQVIQLDDANVWVYFVIETTNAAYHPIHLHGHDFYVLAQESGATFSDSVTMNLDNPIRRDVIMLPSAGYVVMGFITDNPGAWLLHCHIAWHTSEGLALQLVERSDDLLATLDGDRLEDTCSNWDTYVAKTGIVQEDAGI